MDDATVTNSGVAPTINGKSFGLNSSSYTYTEPPQYCQHRLPCGICAVLKQECMRKPNNYKINLCGKNPEY